MIYVPHFRINLLFILFLVSTIYNDSIVYAQQSVRHDFLTIGEKSGEQILTQNSDGSTTISFSYNDRGRGPETITRYTLDASGLPTKIKITGLNYSKSKIFENYSRNGNSASWDSNIEHGNTKQAENSFFWPVNRPPEFLAILARALLQNEDRKLAMLPNGTANIETLKKKIVKSENGKVKNITLFAITGLGDAPSYIWLDEKLNLFGSDNDWFALTPEGFDKTYTIMKDVQEKVENRRLIDSSARLQNKLNGLTAFTNVDLFDSISGSLIHNKTVYVMDGLVTSVVDADKTISEEAKIIDGTGKTMIPGLWDMHGHISPPNFFNYLALGITDVRDMANDPEFIIKARRDIASGTLAAPDIYALGFIDKKTEFAAPTGRLAETLDEAIGFVDYYARRGFVGIKLYSSIEPEWVKPITKHAHALGLTVQGHVPAYMEATQAIEDGFDEITHINMAMLDLLNAGDVDTRTPLRFKVPGSKGGTIDVNGTAMDKLVALMKKHSTAIDPTVNVFLEMFLNEPGTVIHSHRPSANQYPTSVMRSVLASKGYNYGDEDNYARSAAVALAMTKRFHNEGIRILAGTDSAPWGFALINELRTYVEDAGIPEAEVLQLATIGAARHMNLDQKLGSITPGKKAHFVLLNSNPLEDIGALLQTHIVVKDNNMFYTSELLHEQGYTTFEETQR